jgi:hypothetical protein
LLGVTISDDRAPDSPPADEVSDNSLSLISCK